MLLTNVHIVKDVVFPVLKCRYESWIIKKVEHQSSVAFEMWCWRRLLRVPWTARWSNQSVLKEISPEYSLEGLMLKLNSNTLSTWCRKLTHCKRHWCWERLKAGEGENIGWDDWMPSSIWWTWVWASSRSWWTGNPGVLQFMGSQSQTRLSDWTELNILGEFELEGAPRFPSLVLNFGCTFTSSGTT